MTSLVIAVPALVYLGILALDWVGTGEDAGVKGRCLRLLPVLLAFVSAIGILAIGGLSPVAHVNLDGVEMDLADEGRRPREIIVGGRPAEAGPAPALQAPGYPPDAFRITTDGKSLVLRPGSGYTKGLLVRNGARIVPVEPGNVPRLVPLRDGDTIQIPSGKLQFREKQPLARSVRLEGPSGTRILPNRSVKIPVVGIPLPVLTRPPWTQSVFPLAENSAGDSPGSCLVAGAPGLGFNRTGLLAMEPSVTVAGETAAQAGNLGRLDAAARLEFLVLRNEASPAGARVQVLARVGTASLAAGGNRERPIPVLRFQYSRPQVHGIPLADIRHDMRTNPAMEHRLAFGLNERDNFAALPHQVRFPQLTSWFQGANAEITLHWLTMEVQDDYHNTTIDYGQPFTIGGADRLALRVERIGIPWKTCFGLALAGLLAVAAAWPWTKGSRFGMSLFFGTSLLLAARVVFANSAWVNAPFVGEPGIAALRAAMVFPMALSITGLLAARIRVPRRLALWQPGWLALAGAACGLLALRVVLLFAGFKEGIDIGGTRVALSLVFVPANLVLFAVAVREFARKSPPGARLASLWAFVACCAVICGCQLGAGALVSDLGTFLYLIPQALVMAVIGGWLAVRLARGRGLPLPAAPWHDMARRWAAALALMLPFLLIVLILATPSSIMRLAGQSAQTGPDAALPTDSTRLRVLQFADKESLVNVGTDAAEGILEDHALMENYAHRGLIGQGYLGVDVVRAEETTALNDNVAAVFLLGQFGVAGAIAIAIAYAAIGAASLGAGPEGKSWIPALAGLAFASTSLYMLGANWGYLPFTGRNMYILGLNSLGDLAESFVLLCLVLIPIARARLSANDSIPTDELLPEDA